MQWLISTMACGLLEAGLSKVVALDPQWSEKVALLEGKVIALELTNISATLYFLPMSSGISVRPQIANKPGQDSAEFKVDVKITGSISGFLELLEARRNDEQLIGGDVSFAGDIAVGQNFEQLLASLSPEWEETLSRMFGDLLSRKIIDSAAEIKIEFKKQLSNFLTNTQDYIQEESRLSPAKMEMDVFFTKTVTLRSDVARLEARIKRLNSNNAAAQQEIK